SSFLSIICLSSPMFGFNDRQLHRIQDSLNHPASAGLPAEETGEWLFARMTRSADRTPNVIPL
ncbi:MAG: hypothetical protein KZQ81_14580, partial [Candidatus Thiodiazotropha sp. (ex Rostrolucina anterorostrata)]|nr:hypothetical protein [Candidatus Thiodiazotropha sp. (ex Rostrolucina anterorostrata)]